VAARLLMPLRAEERETLAGAALLRWRRLERDSKKWKPVFRMNRALSSRIDHVFCVQAISAERSVI
jgi:hypothetical protein